MAKVEPGNVVKLNYTGKLPDGTVFGSSEGAQPLEFAAGSEQMITGVSKAVIGMEEGEKKTIDVEPEEGFGSRQPNLEQKVPRSNIPDNVNPGDQLLAQAGDQKVPVWVKEINDDYCLVDGNHPLAGVKLTFDLEVVGIDGGDGTTEQNA